MRVLKACYTVVFALIIPFVVLRVWIKSIKQPAYRTRLGERFGCYKADFKACDFWVHAVSFGEVEVATPLIDKMIEEGFSVCVTTTTTTGSKRVRDCFADKVSHVYLPYEIPYAIRRFLNTFKPKVAVVMETEIWPNLYQKVFKKAIPCLIANARLSPRSLKGYQKIGYFMRPILSKVTLVMAQTKEDRMRFCQLGAKAQNVIVSGNIKFDIKVGDKEASTGLAYKKALGERKVFLAASTHPGEEEKVLEAFRKIKNVFKDALLILAPRHPKRVGEISRYISEAGFECQKRSMTPDIKEVEEVYLIDTLGELKMLYHVADVAFVGGSLVNHGGHNVLEAVVANVPVVVGPHMFNFEEIYQKLNEAQGLLLVDSTEALGRVLVSVLREEIQTSSLIDAASRVLLDNQGALEKHWQAIRAQMV